MPDVNETQLNYLDPDSVEKSHEMSIQCDKIGEERKFEESKITSLAAIDEEPSDEDNFSLHSVEGAVNKVTVGIQTNDAHFRKIEKTAEFLRKRQQRLESTDWALSPIFDDIHFAKQKKTIGGRKIV